MAAIQLELVNKAAADHPGLEDEIEVGMAACDKYLQAAQRPARAYSALFPSFAFSAST